MTETQDRLAEIHGFLPDIQKRIDNGVEGYNFPKCATALDPRGPYHKEDVIAAMIVAAGNYADMAKFLGRSRAAVKRYVESNDDVAEFYSNYREGMLDTVEANLFREAMKPTGDLGVQKWLLSTVGKNRGYSSRSEVTGADGKPIEVDAVPASSRLNTMLNSLKPKEEPKEDEEGENA